MFASFRLVHVTYFITEGTIEESIYSQLEQARKRQERKSMGSQPTPMLKKIPSTAEVVALDSD